MRPWLSFAFPLFQVSVVQHKVACYQHMQQQQQQLLPVMPRAAARLVGHWVADLKNDDRPAVYTALTVLLVQPAAQQQQQGASSSSSDVDVVLQLAAVSALRTLVDDFGFEGQGFVGVLPAVLRALCGMLQASEELDTQTQVRGSQQPGAKTAEVLQLLAFVLMVRHRVPGLSP
jgi:hypothetical protein